MTTPCTTILLNREEVEEVINKSGIKFCFIGERTLVERQIGPVWLTIVPTWDSQKDLTVFPFDPDRRFPPFCTWKLHFRGSATAEVLLRRQDDGANLGRKAHLSGLENVTLTVQTVHGKMCKCPGRGKR